MKGAIASRLIRQQHTHVLVYLRSVWKSSNSSVASMVASLSRFASTNARDLANVSCDRMLAYRKLLSKGSFAASFLVSDLHSINAVVQSLSMAWLVTSCSRFDSAIS